MATTFQMTPFVKWAGGKGQLVDKLLARVPKKFNRYYEPFVGGGALLLALAPKKATINDSNEQLINVFNQLQRNIEGVMTVIRELDSIECDKERYYSIRDQYNKKISAGELDEECAGLMIWMNKHCFNGLYRVNRKGLFNVPYNNKKTGHSFDEDNLRHIGEYLRKNKVNINCMDFEKICSRVRPGDFVYFDSPYVPISTTANFTDYTADGFTMKDHERLAVLFRKLAEKGVKVMLSNHNVPLVKELYEGFIIEEVDVKRLINSDVNKRTGKEVIIRNDYE